MLLSVLFGKLLAVSNDQAWSFKYYLNIFITVSKHLKGFFDLCNSKVTEVVQCASHLLYGTQMYVTSVNNYLMSSFSSLLRESLVTLNQRHNGCDTWVS